MEHLISVGGMAVVAEEKGAQLCSVKWNGHEYLWQGDPAYWEDRSPLLFPYVGRFTEGKYTLHGGEYEMLIHGFAKDSEFSLIEKTPARMVFLLEDNDETLLQYPYHFSLKVSYEIAGSTLTVSYDVENRTDETMYFGIGGHPGFQVPLDDDLTFEDYRLVFSSPHTPDRVGHTKACFLSGSDAPYALEWGTDLPLHHDMFDEDAIVLKNVSDTVCLTSDQGTRSVTMHYPDLPYLGIWHAPGTDAPYVCIEPWSSLPSRQDIIEEFAFKSDLIRLAAGKTWHTAWQMTLA